MRNNGFLGFSWKSQFLTIFANFGSGSNIVDIVDTVDNVKSVDSVDNVNSVDSVNTDHSVHSVKNGQKMSKIWESAQQIPTIRSPKKVKNLRIGAKNTHHP